MKLADLVDQTVLALIPRIHQTQYQRVKLLDVEQGGIWIESQAITNALLQAGGVATAPNTLVIFLPYHEVSAILTAIPVPSLDEKAFGV
jgi:hypothetical protein